MYEEINKQITMVVKTILGYAMDQQIDKAAQENMENGMSEEEAMAKAQETPKDELPPLTEAEENQLIQDKVPEMTDELVKKELAKKGKGKDGKDGKGDKEGKDKESGEK